MARISEVTTESTGRIRVEITTGTGKVIHRLPKEQAVALFRALETELDVRQQGLEEVLEP